MFDQWHRLSLQGCREFHFCGSARLFSANVKSILYLYGTNFLNFTKFSKKNHNWIFQHCHLIKRLWDFSHCPLSSGPPLQSRWGNQWRCVKPARKTISNSHLISRNAVFSTDSFYEFQRHRGSYDLLALEWRWIGHHLDLFIL